MSNQRYNDQTTLKQARSGGKGVLPLKGEPQKSSLNLSVPNWPGLPGREQKDRSRGIPSEKIYAQSKGLLGGNDDDEGSSSLYGKTEF